MSAPIESPYATSC